MNYDLLTLNGQIIDAQRLKAEPKDFKIFKRKWMGDPAIPEFLENWWNLNKTLPAYTSGSTGFPKKILLKKTLAVKSAKATLEFLKLKPGDTALLSMPAHYIAGRMMLVRGIVGQLNVITINPSAIPIIPNQLIDLAAFTPHQFQGILQSDNYKNLYNIKTILLGGSPVPEELFGHFEKFTGRIYETFGMTETYSHIALKQCHPIRQEFFEALGPTTFSTDNEKLIINAPHLGIMNLQTTDIIHLESSTRFRWLGRADYLINSGGIKLHPEIIEKKLSRIIHKPYFISGMKDEAYGQKVVLIIEGDGSTSLNEDIQNKINQVLGKYEKPKSILWVDNMIMTPTGKINRKATKSHYNI